MPLRTTAAALLASSLLLFAAACGDDDGTAAYCDRLTSIQDSLDLGSADIADTETMAEAARTFGDVVDVAPDSTRGDWQQVADFFGRLADGDGLADFSTDDAATVETALNNVNTDMQETCDLEI